MITTAPLNVAVVGGRAGLVAHPFETAWGHVQVHRPDEVDRVRADLTVILDPDLDPQRFNAANQVLWHPDPPAVERRARIVARPWPVADDLFDMGPSPREDVCLVIAPDGTAADTVIQRLRERRLRVHVVPAVTPEVLADATIVVSLTEHLPAETFAILAARRLLVARGTDSTFGLQDWVDFVPFTRDDDLVQVADMLAACPGCWGSMRALARQSAEPYRASRALGRLVRRVGGG